jgi:hypothetical protein
VQLERLNKYGKCFSESRENICFFGIGLDNSASVITGGVGGVTDMCKWLIYQRGRIQQVKSECFKTLLPLDVIIFNCRDKWRKLDYRMSL